MSETYNLRNPEEGEVSEMYAQAKQRRLANEKYSALKKLLNGETIDLRNNPQLFEALNRERMEFDTILKLHHDQAQSAMLEAERDRGLCNENQYWNRHSKAKWGCLGHIPPCVYYSRPSQYWKDKSLLKQFFNMYPKFRVSSKPL
jgi:hypothetical protein